MYNPLYRLITWPTKPIVTFLDFRSSVTDLTTYTTGFENLNCFVYGGGGFIASDTPALGPGVPSIGRTLILGIVHSEDAAVTFSVTSFSIGGIAGTELVDRGGGTSAVNTAIYAWDPVALSSAATTDGSIVFSEGITSCGVGILAVSNLMYPTPLGASSTVGTSVMPLQTAVTATQMEQWIRPGIAIFATTLVSTAGLAWWDTNDLPTTYVNGRHSIMLYAAESAEASYTAAYCIVPHTVFSTSSLFTMDGPQVNWQGGGAGDLVTLFFQ